MADLISNGVPNPHMIYGRAPNGQLQAVTTDGSGNLNTSVGGSGGGAVPTTQGTVAAQTAAWTSATAANSAVSIATTGYGTVEASIQTSGTANTLSDGLETYSLGDLHTANGNWVYAAGTLAVVANGLGGNQNNGIFSNAAGSNFAYRNDISWPNDQYVECVMIVGGAAATQSGGPAVRVAVGAATGYCVEVANNLFRLSKYVAGAQTTLGTSATVVKSIDIVRLSISGSNLTVTLNGVTAITATDSALTSGNAGIVGSGNSTVNGIAYWTAGMPTNPSVAFEASDDAGTTWYPMQGGRPGNFIADTSYDLTGSTQSWQFSNTGYTNLRVRLVNPLITGTANVRVQAAAAPSQDVVISTPQGLYVKSTDFLWINTTSIATLSSAQYYVTYRLQPPTGPAIQVSTTKYITPTTSVFIAFAVPLQEGWLQNVSVTPGTTTPYTSFGNSYIQMFLDSQGLQFQVFKNILLTAGVCTQNYTLSWPSTSITVPQQVPGLPSSIYPANPSAGAEITWNPSIAFRYKIHSFAFTYTASSAAANRYMGLYMRTNNTAKNNWVMQNPTPVTASQSGTVTFAPGVPYNMTQLTSTTFFMTSPLPDQIWFSGASNAATGQDGISFLSSNSVGIQAGDQISNVTIRAEIQNDTD